VRKSERKSEKESERAANLYKGHARNFAHDELLPRSPSTKQEPALCAAELHLFEPLSRKGGSRVTVSGENFGSETAAERHLKQDPFFFTPGVSDLSDDVEDDEAEDRSVRQSNKLGQLGYARIS
jgi:hypothetical protein